jgi:hypothetical protein
MMHTTRLWLRRHHLPMLLCGLVAKMIRHRKYPLTFHFYECGEILINFHSADPIIAAQATGAMSWAFIIALKANSIRDQLATKYSQKPQLSCSHPLSKFISAWILIPVRSDVKRYRHQFALRYVNFCFWSASAQTDIPSGTLSSFRTCNAGYSSRSADIWAFVKWKRKMESKSVFCLE